MTSALPIEEMSSYLESTGWRLLPERWRGASIWQSRQGAQVLVPARDDMDDAAERTWELLQTVSKVEGRPTDEVAEDIASPMVDTQLFRTFPKDLPSGYTGLTAGLRALQGVRNLIDAAARVEVEGVRARFLGNHPPSVGRILDEARLGTTKPGSYTFLLRIPVLLESQSDVGDAAATPLSRRTVIRMHTAILALHSAISTAQDSSDFSVIDNTISSGVSANLTRSLSDLAGLDRSQPFEVQFRLARAVPESLSPATILFPAESGTYLYEASRELERLDVGEQAQMIGFVDSLYDKPELSDRWRILVHGELITTSGDINPRRPVWVRLSEAEYDLAVEAHRLHSPVRVHGVLRFSGQRVEISATPNSFGLIEE